MSDAPLSEVDICFPMRIGFKKGDHRYPRMMNIPFPYYWPLSRQGFTRAPVVTCYMLGTPVVDYTAAELRTSPRRGTTTPAKTILLLS